MGDAGQSRGEGKDQGSLGGEVAVKERHLGMTAKEKKRRFPRKVSSLFLQLTPR
jgi:hypothetical protein